MPQCYWCGQFNCRGFCQDIEDTEWFIRKARSFASPHESNPNLILIGDPRIGDKIRIPDHPGLPGGTFYIKSIEVLPCILRGHDHETTHYIFDGTEIRCCECDQFYWYRLH